MRTGKANPMSSNLLFGQEIDEGIYRSEYTWTRGDVANWVASVGSLVAHSLLVKINYEHEAYLSHGVEIGELEMALNGKRFIPTQGRAFCPYLDANRPRYQYIQLLAAHLGFSGNPVWAGDAEHYREVEEYGRITDYWRGVARANEEWMTNPGGSNAEQWLPDSALPACLQAQPSDVPQALEDGACGHPGAGLQALSCR